MCPRLAILGSAGTWRSNKWTASEGRSVAESDFRQITGFTFQRKVFAERKERIAVPHENPAQIGMIGETDPHHVKDLAFVPIGGFPQMRDGGDLEIVLGDLGLEPEMNVLC